MTAHERSANVNDDHFDMPAAVRHAVRAAGFEPDLDDAARRQLDAITAPVSLEHDVRDLRDRLWSSIDNNESRDLDQVEVAEALADGAIRLTVGIADVDSLVPKDSPLDKHAFANCTSVYTGVEVFSMLPEKLSTDFTSLNEGEDRLAIAIETVVGANGVVVSHDVYRAMVRNTAKLTYEGVGAYFEGGAVPDKVAGNPALVEQIRLQREAATRLKAERIRNGALEFDTIEATPVARDGRIVDLRVVHKNRARDLIEDFMIASNIAIAKYLESQQRAGIRRVVREPQRWHRIVDIAKQHGVRLPADPDSRALASFLIERRTADPDHFPDLSLSIVKLMGPGVYALDLPGKDPGGHFGLAAHDYSHATAPNRRYADLVTQRLVKAALAGRPAPYTHDELTAIAARCTERENAENKVERTVRKTAAALLLRDRIGHTFNAIVTGASTKGTFARTLDPPAEGMVVKSYAGFDVGDKVRVRLLSADPVRGHIDFEGAQL
jgi:VacB/RNase II family 3'-5' exoribonuclease